MSEEELNAIKADIQLSVQRMGDKWGVNLADPDFHKSTIGGKMLGAGFVNVLGNYPTADQQKQVLNVGLDWLGEQHGAKPGLTTQVYAGNEIVKGLLKSGAMTEEDLRTSWGFPAPVKSLFEFLSSNPEISITSGLHELEDEFGPQ